MQLSSSVSLSPPPSIFPSIRVFSSELGIHIRWPKYWSFNLSISPSKEYRVDFFRDWLFSSPCSPRDSKEPSPAPQLKNINSLVLMKCMVVKCMKCMVIINCFIFSSLYHWFFEIICEMWLFYLWISLQKSEVSITKYLLFKRSWVDWIPKSWEYFLDHVLKSLFSS